MSIEQYQVSTNYELSWESILMFSLYDVQKSIAQKNTSLQDLNEDINRLANLQVHMQAKHAKAQQIMQAQQIANMLFGSQQHISATASNHRSPMSQSNFGSSPHISQPHSPQQPIHYNNVRPISRDSHQFINEQGQYVTPVSNNHQSYSSYVDNENSIGGLYQYESHQVCTLQSVQFNKYLNLICFFLFIYF